MKLILIFITSLVFSISVQSFEVECKKHGATNYEVVKDNDGTSVKHDRRFNSLISETNSLNYLSNISKIFPKVRFSSNEILIIDYIKNNKIKKENYQKVLAKEISLIHYKTNINFGFKFDSQIGGLKQPNLFNDSWVVFFRDKRLNLIFEIINKNNPMPREINLKLEIIINKLNNFIPNKPKPRLLHGDLWEGNILFNDGKLVGLIDPGIYFGHNELEISYLTWFNFVDSKFLEFYNYYIQIEQNYSDYEAIYQLYFSLLNVHLWDRNYIKDVQKLLNKIKI